ncbi:MAG TPA: class I tRNA ligase family protein [Allosphingosinicella sp.]
MPGPTTPPVYIVTLPPPTPNGSLHVGHLAGPFLAADVFVKAARLAGSAALAVSYSDSNQSYVQATAARLGLEPQALASQCSREILEALALYGCSVDSFSEPTAASNGFVRELVLGLHRRGGLVEKEMSFFYSPGRGRFLGEAEVAGFCPNCLDRCKCGICEGCAFINSAETLVSPREAISGPADLERRKARVLVLEMEPHRAAIQAFYAADRPFRPRYRWLIEDALRQRLPDFPVSVPGDWGIALGADFPGCVVNPWAEVMGQFLYCYRDAAGRLPAGGDRRVVNFFGFDNSYFYGIVHIALLSALGQMKWAPYVTMINEFYDLEHRKFSTSHGHVLWAADLARRHDPDLVRFYLALVGPGFERANFSEPEMAAAIEERVARPWRELASHHNRRLGSLAGRLAAPSPAVREAGLACLERIASRFSLERFHLRQAAEDLIHLLDFAAAHGSQDADDDAQILADTAHLVRCFARAVYPLCPGAAARLAGSSGAPPDPEANLVAAPATLPYSLFGPDGRANAPALALESAK